MTRLSSFCRAIIMALLVVSVLGAYALLRQLDRARPPESEVSLTPPQTLAAFSENGVTVKIALEQDTAGHISLVGTLTPEQAHFHLYSKDLPRDGIRGQGRPTLLEIVAPHEVKPIGALQADQPTQDHYSRAIEQSLPVYPVGPVILRLPIEFPTSSAALSAELSVTYMACSEDTCLTPVVDEHVTVVIPTVAGRLAANERERCLGLTLITLRFDNNLRRRDVAQSGVFVARPARVLRSGVSRLSAAALVFSFADLLDR